MNTVTETCPSLEDLAAFLDGKLSEGERARIVAHLADCESCYTVFVGAARFQLEEENEAAQEPEKAAAAVVPFRRRNTLPWIAAAALAALLLIGLALIPRLYRSYETMPMFASTELVPAGVLADAQGWSEGVMRGGESASAYKVAEFLVGVHLVDLYLALSRDNANDALNALSPIITHIPNFLTPHQEAQFYKEVHRQIASGKNPRTFAIEAAQKEASLTKAMAEEGSSYLEFGKWAEAGRLSALARQPAFFQNDETPRFLGWLVHNAEEQDLAPKVVRDLEQTRDLLDEAEPPQFPYDALARRFTSILRYYQGESRSGSAY